MSTRQYLILLTTIVLLIGACSDSQEPKLTRPVQDSMMVFLNKARRNIDERNFDSADYNLQITYILADQLSNERIIASVWANYGYMNALMYRNDSSEYFYQKAIDIHARTGDTLRWIQHLRDQGITLRDLGKYGDAIDNYELAKNLAVRVGDSTGIGGVHNSIGNILLELGEYNQAIDQYNQAILVWFKDKRRYSIALQNKADAMISLNSVKEALPLLKQSLRIKDSLKRSRSKAYTLAVLGETYIALDSLGLAENVLNQSLGIRDSLGDKSGVAEAILRLSLVDILRDRFVSASNKLKRVERIAFEIKKPDLLRDVYNRQKDLYKAWNRMPQLILADSLYAVMNDSIYREQRLKVQEAQSEASLQREQQRTALAEQRERVAQLEADSERQKGLFRLAVAIVAILGVFVIGWQLWQIRKRNASLIALNARIKLITDNAFHSQKNALGLISAMLRSQARQTKHEKELEVLRDVEGKIEALGGVSRYLFQRRIEDNTAVAARIQLHTYLSDLVTDTFASVAHNGAQLHTDLKEIEVTSTEALNVGLIANEAVTNFSKYAETKGADQLWIKGKKEEGKLQLSFSDNGPGFPKDFKLSESHGFGMQMMANLVDDMDGDLAIERQDEFTHIKITIPLKT